jgi:hypothetical protein
VLKLRVLDYKKCEGSVKLNDTNLYINGASLKQIGALYLLRVMSERLILEQTKAAEHVLNPH